jgi:hypothetical protein
MPGDNRKSDYNPKTDPVIAGQSNVEKDPEDWVTGDEPMTGAQASYLKTLCEETGETFDDTLSKAEASKRIDELRSRDQRINPGKRTAL